LILGKRVTEMPKKASPIWAPFYDAGYAPVLDGLEYVYRAVTPPIRPIRFNARFFLADGSKLYGNLQGDGELLNLLWLPIPKAIELRTPPIQKIVLKAVPDMVDKAGKIKRPQRVPVRIMRHGKRGIEYE
ncbi:uncharacterized protein METZ01_LOCUS482410, partial [marine metagenome]